MMKKNFSIKYILIDRQSNQKEEFDFESDELNKYDFSIREQFTGIEWWNKIGFYPFKIRYNVQISEIMYGIEDNNKSIIFNYYTSLIPNKDNTCKVYPIAFNNVVINENNNIQYQILSGMCRNGIQFNC